MEVRYSLVLELANKLAAQAVSGVAPLAAPAWGLSLLCQMPHGKHMAEHGSMQGYT